MSDATGGGMLRAARPPQDDAQRDDDAEPQDAAAAPAAVFRANCTHCRSSFQLDAGALRLAIGASSRSTFYSFTCPECGEAVRKPAGERIVELLTGGGVPTMRLTGG
ncbi:hypothetical protein [Actinacidiphila sp. bgisy145]|uniref:hypothetical protein n=1 Tax=Actinacidiphila sp. bgisy145 TaxID=3413792 RepID=UPI003EB8F4D6